MDRASVAFDYNQVATLTSAIRASCVLCLSVWANARAVNSGFEPSSSWDYEPNSELSTE